MALAISLLCTSDVKGNLKLGNYGDTHYNNDLYVYGNFYLSRINKTNNSSVVNPIIPGDSLDTLQRVEVRREVLSREMGRRLQPLESPGLSDGEAKKLYQDNTNNCAQWAKRQAGITKSIGAGGRGGINTQNPREGIVGAERGIIHAVYITKVDGDQITFQESNFIRGWITERTLPRSSFIGFIE